MEVPNYLKIEAEVCPYRLHLLENEVRRRAGHTAVSYNGKIYLWGGYMEEVKERTYDLMTRSAVKYHDPKHIWIYEPLINVWYRKSCTGDIPLHLSGSYFASSYNFLYIFGGYCGEPSDSDLEEVKNNLWKLNLDTFVWKLICPNGDPPFAADKGTSWFYKDRFYVFGGFGCTDTYPLHSEPYRRVNYVTESDNNYGSRGWFDQLVYYDQGKNLWVWPKSSGNLPTPRAAHAVAVIRNIAYIFGGRFKENRLNDFYSLNLNTHVWSLVYAPGTVPVGRSWHSLTALSNHQLLLYGGFSTLQQVLSDIWSFDLNANKWHHISWIKSGPRLWHVSVKIGLSDIFSIGGISNNILDYTNPKEHAEEMLCIRFSPPTLFRIMLEYVSNNMKLLEKSKLDELPPFIKCLIDKRIDPFEVHGL